MIPTDALTVLQEMRSNMPRTPPYVRFIAALDTAIAACILVRQLAQEPCLAHIERFDDYMVKARALFPQEPT